MLTSTITQVKQSGNGVIVAFDFSFKILATTDLVVYKIDASGSLGAALVLGTDYTVTFDPIAENGTVTYTVAPVSGGYSLIQRSSDTTQQTSLPREGVAPAKTLETMIDKLAARIQELQTNIDNAVLGQYSNVVKTGTFAYLDSLANITPFIAIATDTRTIMVFTGSRSDGNNGWTALGGY